MADLKNLSREEFQWLKLSLSDEESLIKIMAKTEERNLDSQEQHDLQVIVGLRLKVEEQMPPIGEDG